MAKGSEEYKIPHAGMNGIPAYVHGFRIMQ
jgi:hypothetical protein